ncbi:MAG: peptide deformylase [Candidatus Levybacteria bacterium]|nr:peptide deformylase [Candidatus Levybacteria bacterium]
MSFQIIANFRKPRKGILQEPNTILRTICTPVKEIDKSTKEIAKKLIDIMHEVDRPYKIWLGMAAPQIGCNQRIIAIKKSYHDYLIMVNPEIMEQKFLLPTITGCYSVSGLYLTNSHYYFKIKYLTLDGENKTEIFIGGSAVLLQQEIDHLNGKLICD